jgi:hypothetical protein
MLDTVKIKFNLSPTDEQLVSWDRDVKTKAGGFERVVYTYRRIIYPSGSLHPVQIYWMYRPEDYTGKPLTTAELSFPKIVFGNNFTMVVDILGAIDQANELIASDPNVPPVDIRKGILLRVDFCWNHYVGEDIRYYIEALGRLKYPHRKTRPYKDEGVCFKAKKVMTRFYDKQTECRSSKAAGILRHETEVRGTNAIGKYLGVKRPTLSDLTEEVAVNVLMEDLKRLGISGCVFATKECALEILSLKYGPETGIYLLGLMHAGNGKWDVAERTGVHHKSLERRFRNIREAGITPVLVPTELPLSPLTIIWGSCEEKSICPKVPTDSIGTSA